MTTLLADAIRIAIISAVVILIITASVIILVIRIFKNKIKKYLLNLTHIYALDFYLVLVKSKCIYSMNEKNSNSINLIFSLKEFSFKANLCESISSNHEA